MIKVDHITDRNIVSRIGILINPKLTPAEIRTSNEGMRLISSFAVGTIPLLNWNDELTGEWTGKFRISEIDWL